MSDRFVLDEFLPFRLNRASERVSLGFAARYRRKYKMTRPEWRVLAALRGYGRLTATQVGARSTMRPTSLTVRVFPRAVMGRRVKSRNSWRIWLRMTIASRPVRC
jgi:hypothetical protein